MALNEASTPERSPIEAALWGVALLVVAALAVPWFMWRSTTVVAGLPVWLWWHIGWMIVASVVFYAFGRRAWGLGIDGTAPRSPDGDEVER